MQDLFGHEVSVYRGQPVETVSFSDAETEKITDEVIFEGLLLKQMAEALQKLKKIKDRKNIGLARREAWGELMWVFDLWHSPAYVPFDLACQIEGADSDLIRSAISHEFAEEIQLLAESITTRFPDERPHLVKKLHQYISLRAMMH